MKNDIPALYLALKHPGTPVSAKVLAAVTVAYTLSPIDLIPDFIPVLGYLDDVLLLPLLVLLTVSQIPKEILAQCRRSSADLWAHGKPKKWYFAIPILVIWAAVLLILYSFFR